MNSQQFVLTRFAVKSRGSGFKGSFPAGWLKRRFALFERYCLPTMQAQTYGEYTWLIFVHRDFADADERRLSAYDPRIKVVRQGLLGRHVDSGADVVISTRLDSDDGLNREALRRIAGWRKKFHTKGSASWLHNFPKGCKLDERAGRLYLCRKPNSAFLTLFERPSAGPVKGALHANHSTLLHRVPSCQDEALRGWLMVVHGWNVSNRITPGDERVAIEELGRWFDIAEASAAR